MPGMNSGLTDNNSTLIAAFRTALLHQGLIILALLLVLGLVWFGIREWVPAARGPGHGPPSGEADGRRLLRIGFGVLWIFDGVLQAQPAMPAGLPTQVMEPTAAASPTWVQHLVNWAGTSWSFHPVQAGAATVWIQLGIGAWLIAAPSGWPSRLGGLASAGWGLVVWVFGEAFGGLFAPGLTFLFGAPGAVMFYCAAGLLIAVPDRYWRSPRLGRFILAGLGVFLIGMAVLQAWPGRGFWQGVVHGQPGSLTTMVTSMAATSQPHVLSALVSGFGSLVATHGFLVNLIAVVVLAGCGAAFVTAKPQLVRPAALVMLLFCLADWILIEDVGFFGGVGTDPNSMIPFALLIAGGYLALVRMPSAVPETAAPEPAASVPRLAAIWFGTAGPRAVLAGWAVLVVLIGAAPMALAETNKTADPIIATAIDGNAAPLNFAAPAFSLTSQDGRPVSLASLHGKVVLLTFLDPVCTTDCPLIAQEFRAADTMLGNSQAKVEMVAIVANPVYRSLAYTNAFDRQERLAGLPNWLFLTGSLRQLEDAWKQYGITAQAESGGGMVAHNDVAYVIDANGRTRFELNFDPGPGTASSESSFAGELITDARHVLRSS